MQIHSIAIKPREQDYTPLLLETRRGTVECRGYIAAGAASCVIFVGGACGGWDSPADGIYPKMASAFRDEGIAALRVRFRRPLSLEESVLDVLTAIDYVSAQGVSSVGLVGHSFGGAVVIQAAAASDLVRTVVTLATQTMGAEAISELAPGCSVLLVHGDADSILPPYCSQWSFFVAGQPKRLVVYEGADHGLDEAAGPLYRLLWDWLNSELA